MSAHKAVIAKARDHDKATAIAILLSLGIWDSTPMDEREAWCERGEVYDTRTGRMLFSLLEAHGGPMEQMPQ